MASQQKSPTPLTTVPKPLLYGRLVFGTFILFALVGNCSGRTTGAVAVAVITAVMWVLTRIIIEALEAYVILTTGGTPPAAKSEKDDGPAPPTPPTAPA